MEQARKNNANDVIHAIESLPMEKFRTTVDISTYFKDESWRC